jgi:hypothetical protein
MNMARQFTALRICKQLSQAGLLDRFSANAALSHTH